MTPPRLALVVSHPIQYQAPWFRALARVTDLTVFFCHRLDAAGQADAGYGVPFDWDVPLLDGYRFVWLANVARRPSVFRFDGCDTPEIFERIRTGGFDVCIVSGWYLKSYVQAILACRRHGVPVLLRGDSQLKTARSTVTKTLKYVPYRLLLNSVAGHLVVGEANRRYLAYYGVAADRLFGVPHVVDTEWFAAGASQARADGSAAAIRGELDIPTEASIILFVGRLVDQKRPLDFVEAVARAARRRRVVGLVAGSGPLGGAIETRAREIGSPIRMIGFRNQSALPAVYAAAQMLVLPSDARETWGLVVNEAMACGTPAVVSDTVGCAPDLIEPHTGRVCGLGDVDGLADAIVALDDLRKSAPGAVQSALLHMTDRFSIARAANATVAAVGDVSHRLSCVTERTA